MENRFDELTKCLAGERPEGEATVSRRDALRRFGTALAGALLASAGLITAASAGAMLGKCKSDADCPSYTICCGGQCVGVLSDHHCGDCHNICNAKYTTCINCLE